MTSLPAATPFRPVGTDFICVEQIARYVIVIQRAFCITLTKNRKTVLVNLPSRLILKYQFMEKQKRVIDPKSYMHTFRLNEQQQVQFEKMMLTAGQRSELRLADGTLLWLNSGTRVTYPTHFNGRQRKIFVDGEVYAEVMHNKQIGRAHV